MALELQEGIKFADLAYWVPSKFEGPTTYVNPYRLIFFEIGGANVSGKFHFPNNFNGYLGWLDDENKTIVVGFSGSELSVNPNWITNICQILRGPDETYNMAMEMLRSVVRSRSNNSEFHDSPIRVYGHSLGGGLMQYALANVCGRDIKGYGYNSAGLSNKTLGFCSCLEHVFDNVSHLYLPNDLVFKTPFTNQLGKAVSLHSVEPNFKVAHGLDSIRKHTGRKGQEVAEMV